MFECPKCGGRELSIDIPFHIAGSVHGDPAAPQATLGHVQNTPGTASCGACGPLTEVRRDGQTVPVATLAASEFQLDVKVGP